MPLAPSRRAWLVVLLVIAAGCLLPLVQQASAEQASSFARSAQGGYLDAGEEHTCAILADRSVRCWGKGLAGRLGYGNESDVLAPAAAGPVNVGPGRDVRALVAGDFHSCAILDDGSVRCWGFGENGRLGYGNRNNVFTPAAAPAVDLGPGRTARAITAGASHTCAILDDGSVRCWGNGAAGRLGYGNTASVGDDEPPSAAGPVNLGPGRTARAIAAGEFHTCAVLDNGQLLCWGFNASGQLGYGGTADVGDNEVPGAAGPVNVGGRTAVAVSGGTGHTCVVLDDGSVKCWGFGANGRLGYGNSTNSTSAAAAPAVSLGRPAQAIAVGDAHSCAILDDGAVRCWGFGGSGRLGYGNVDSIGDTELPSAAGPVSLGAGRTARAITAGFSHTCALLDDGTLRCWGFGGSGRLGYGNELSVGDDETPAAAGPVALGGPVPATAANLTAVMGVDNARPAVGGGLNLTLSVGNSGPDPTAGVSLTVAVPPGIAVLSVGPTQGVFDPAAGRWNVGALAPGASATARIAARAAASGNQVVAAEVATSSTFDPTSTPGNGVAEDDRAAVLVAVPATGARISRLPRPRSLSLKVVRSPRRGTLRRIAASGRLLLPRARPALRCVGKVRVRATVKKRVVAQRTVRLRPRKRVCRYAAVIRPKRLRGARAVIVRARFLGTSRVAPRDSRATGVKVKLPPRRPARRR